MKEKTTIDTERYKNLLITANLVTDRLAFKIEELNVSNKQLEISKKVSQRFKETLDLTIENNNKVIEGMEYQFNKMKEYIKYLKKGITKAWFNGLWQGTVLGVVIIVVLLLL